jgi:glyceraldehyde-3-phosphate dehydrogenase type I
MSKKIRVGINGLGRIGRALIREFSSAYQDYNYEIVAINNPGNPEIYAHLIQYDSIHGTFEHGVALDNGKLMFGQFTLDFYSQSNPADIPWDKSNVDIVIDSSGIFRDQKSLSAHLGSTVKKVVLCAPGKDLSATLVYGINHENFNPETDHIVSNASCTTNCLAPIAKVLNDEFGIESGFMTTIHAYTNDQNLLDSSHKDFRRARAAACSMIPTSTGAAQALGLVIPELSGKLNGYAVRVPTTDVSLVDLNINFKKKATIEQIDQALLKASEGPLKGILAYCDKELVSADFTGHPASSIYDSKLTQVIGNSAKVVAWYDNEIGFTNRVLDLTEYIGKKTWL